MSLKGSLGKALYYNKKINKSNKTNNSYKTNGTNDMNVGDTLLYCCIGLLVIVGVCCVIAFF